MANATKLYRAGSANYRGDVSDVVGLVMGPTTYGAPVVASTAVYDPATDRTRVDFVFGDARTVEIVQDKDGHRTVRPATVNA